MTADKKIGIYWILVVITIFTSLSITLIFNITLSIKDMEMTLTNVHKYTLEHIIELILDTSSNIFLIIATILMYKKYSNDKIFWGTLWFIIGGVIMIIHNMGNFAITDLANNYISSTTPNKQHLITTSMGIILTAKWGVTIASLFFLLGTFQYSSVIIYHNKYIGICGIIASIAGIPALVTGRLGMQYEMLSYRLWSPMLIWQISIGIWYLISKNRTKEVSN